MVELAQGPSTVSMMASRTSTALSLSLETAFAISA